MRAGGDADAAVARLTLFAEDASVGEGVEVAAGAVDLRALWNTRRDLSHDEVVLRDVQSGERRPSSSRRRSTPSGASSER